MRERSWRRARPPEPRAGGTVLLASPRTPAQLSALRTRLRHAVAAGTGRVDPASVADDVERLWLVFEELASNGLRHGALPVTVAVSATGAGWLIVVSDAAVDRPPVPALGRDPAAGGMGLHIVASLASAHGWTVTGARAKAVWAVVGTATPPSDAVRSA